MSVTRFQNREDWLTARGAGIGSSDAAVIMGVSPYKSPFVLYQEKIGAQKMTRGELEALTWGVVLEGPIVERYGNDTGRAVQHNALAEMHSSDDPEMPWQRATIDALISPGATNPPGYENDAGVLEVKNVSSYVAERWREEPPIEFVLQAQHQLMVTGLRWGSIAALLGGNRFVYADVFRDEELIRFIRLAEIDFWSRIQHRIPPPVDGSEHTREMLKVLYPKDNGQTVQLPPEAIDWDAALVKGKTLIKDGEALKDMAQAQIINAMGEATYGRLPNGTTFSHRLQQRKAYPVAASEYRVLRRNAPKTRASAAGFAVDVEREGAF